MAVKSDIEIAQEAKLLHIREVAAKLGIEKDGPLCSCGRKGCLKSYVSSSYLADILKISDFRSEDFGAC